MADAKISQLPGATSIAGSDLFAIAQSGVTKSLPFSVLSSYILPALSATTPLQYNPVTGVFSIPQANGSMNGFLASADWNTFDSASDAVLGATNGLAIVSNVLQPVYGATANTITQGNDARLAVQNRAHVKLNPGVGEYATVGAALASITNATALNPWVIFVEPGVYTENQLVMKPYIAIRGINRQEVILTASNNNQPFVIGADNSSLSQVTITGATGPNGVGVQYAANSIDINFLVEYCVFGNNTTELLAQGSSFGTNVIVDSCVIFNANFTNGFVTDGTTGNASMTINGCVVNNYGLTTPPTNYILAHGSGANLLMTGVLVTGLNNASETGLNIYDGATVAVVGLNIANTGHGILVQNIGAGPVLDLQAINIHNTTQNITINHPSTTGTLEAIAKLSLCTFNSGTIGNLSIGILDPSGDLGVSGQINQQQLDGSFQDISTLSREGATMGYFSGGVISPVTGFEVSVSSGYGYLDSTGEVDTIGSIHRINWNTTTIILSANSNVYLYFDINGNLNANSVLPDIEKYILIGRVVTNATGILFIDEEGEFAHHKGNVYSIMMREAFGPIFANGSITSINGSFGLNVTAGSYFYAALNFMPSGGSPISWSSFYQNGSGGYVEVDGVSLVDGANYDNGSGTLQPLTASYYAKHAIYLVGQGANERYFLVYSQAQYASLVIAQGADNPTPPSSFTDSVVIIASIIVQQGTSSIAQILDQRPRVGFAPAGVSAAIYHSNLLGLTVGDDHPQYWRGDGTHVATGDFNLGSQNITNVDTLTAQIVEVNDIALGDYSTKAANTTYVDQMSMVNALIFG